MAGAENVEHWKTEVRTGRAALVRVTLTGYCVITRGGLASGMYIGDDGPVKTFEDALAVQRRWVEESGISTEQLIPDETRVVTLEIVDPSALDSDMPHANIEGTR